MDGAPRHRRPKGAAPDPGLGLRLIVLAAVVVASAAAVRERSATTPVEPRQHGATHSPGTPQRDTVAAAGSRPNILLVTFDTTRADHTSAYGYERPTTPRLDALLPESVRFAEAHTPMPTTLPSHATLFTSRTPRSLGLLKNGWVLPDDAVTLAEVLSSAGWRTAGFVSSFVLDRRFGPMQGFATYDDQFSDSPCKSLGRNWEGRDLETSFCRRGAETVGRALAWLEEGGYLGADPAADEPPFFLFVHLFDPHNPYVPPPEDAALFPPPGENPTRLERDVAAYDGEIHYADAQLGKLVDALARAGRLDRTLVVITADHGEGLMQHGWMHHGMQVYEESVRVPLVVRWPERVRGGRTLDAPVGIIDVAPTILDVAGPGSTGLAGSEGRSLAQSLVATAPLDPVRPIFLQRRHYESPVVGGVAVKGSKYGVRVGKHKYIAAPEESTRELYDLAADPGETRNLVDSDPATAERLASVLSTWLDGGATKRDNQVAPSDAERLRALGYVE